MMCVLQSAGRRSGLGCSLLRWLLGRREGRASLRRSDVHKAKLCNVFYLCMARTDHPPQIARSLIVQADQKGFITIDVAAKARYRQCKPKLSETPYAQMNEADSLAQPTCHRQSGFRYLQCFRVNPSGMVGKIAECPCGFAAPIVNQSPARARVRSRGTSHELRGLDNGEGLKSR